MRYLQAAIVPVLTVTILCFAGSDAEAAKGVKKNASEKISGKVVATANKNGMETVVVKTHDKKKKGAAVAANPNLIAAPAAGKKKGKGKENLVEFTVDASTRITSMGGGGGGAKFAGKGKGKGRPAAAAGGNRIRAGDLVVATVTQNHHATSVEVTHENAKGKGKGKKKN